MNFDMTHYLGGFGAAIAAAGVLIIGYLNNRTSNNLDTKISNMESELLESRQEKRRMQEEIYHLQHDMEQLQDKTKALYAEFEEYRRTHP